MKWSVERLNRTNRPEKFGAYPDERKAREEAQKLYEKLEKSQPVERRDWIYITGPGGKRYRFVPSVRPTGTR